MLKKIYKRLDSTNNEARILVDSGEVNSMAWIQARDQFKGKGLGKNTWHSEKGKNITGSLVVFPDDLKAEDQFVISIASSLAVCDLLDLYTHDVKIKWPNDIYLRNNKIGGLLVEHTVIGDSIKNSILGIGLNVNQEDFNNDIPNPISLKILLGFEFDLEEIRELLLGFLMIRIEQASGSKRVELWQEYEMKLYRFREYAPYKSGNEWFKSKIIGVNKYGQLILETEDGEKLEFGFKEVEFIED